MFSIHISVHISGQNAMKNSHLEHKYSAEVPEAARADMEEMSKVAASIQEDIKNYKLKATIPKVTAVKKLMEKMLPKLTDKVQHEMYEYLLIPWITKLEEDVQTDLLSKHLYDVYYAFKNAIMAVGREYDDVPDVA